MKPVPQQPLNILLADDDSDDRYFFEKALKSLPFSTKFVTVEDGEKLMTYLLKKSDKLPDVLFLDLNMPRKNGAECLLEIKCDPTLQQLPVIIYSTSYHETVADVFYKNGAHYYVCKRTFIELKEILRHICTLIVEQKLVQPARDGFELKFVGV